MSTNMSVICIKPPDDTWRKMKTVWDACQQANVLIPKEVYEYFSGNDPDNAGVIMDAPQEAMEEYSGEMEDGIDVYLDKLPKNVKIVRFICSY